MVFSVFYAVDCCCTATTLPCGEMPPFGQHDSAGCWGTLRHAVALKPLCNTAHCSAHQHRKAMS
jgi:hypothetical protein